MLITTGQPTRNLLVSFAYWWPIYRYVSLLIRIHSSDIEISDGFRGPLIVHDPAALYTDIIDQEVILTVSDWYHDQAPYLINYFQSPLNEDLHGGSEPVPNATLINEARNVHFSMTPGRSYLFRIINMGAFAAQYLQFDQHDMTIVEVDGVYTEPYKVSQLFLTVAQRYSVIVKAKPNARKNFAITASMNEGMFDDGVIPPNLNNNVRGTFQACWMDC